jgi:hypothetical protein
MIFMEVATVVTGQSFDEHNTWHLRWPRAAPAEFCQPRALPGKRRDPAAVEYEIHAL